MNTNLDTKTQKNVNFEVSKKGAVESPHKIVHPGQGNVTVEEYFYPNQEEGKEKLYMKKYIPNDHPIEVLQHQPYSHLVEKVPMMDYNHISQYPSSYADYRMPIEINNRLIPQNSP